MILVNLCVSLVGFIVIFYLTLSITGTNTGCRIANMVRLYLVLVSLMWNGVEGVNMYLSLVKVIYDHISDFMLKAAVLAWGKHNVHEERL